MIVDGATVMDADVNPRRGELPGIEELKASLQRGANGQFQPWAVCAIQALALSLQPMLMGKEVGDVTITVTTRQGGWALDVASS
ncbi:MFS transporter [Mycobacterium hackensackense]|uniref:MFS transporter n=1 Tax=Mycobacterium hackensackense TaxID=228909 RepID=UPI0022659668|nr:MFS transporter [Mycobacterium hackensackense]MCV7255339.1 MFS transporter [Mycobacterium hackensackense]